MGLSLLYKGPIRGLIERITLLPLNYTRYNVIIVYKLTFFFIDVSRQNHLSHNIKTHCARIHSFFFFFGSSPFFSFKKKN
ncbi:unnamed protein product, partial [Vitis vinifera]